MRQTDKYLLQYSGISSHSKELVLTELGNVGLSWQEGP